MTSSHEIKPYSRTKRLFYWISDRRIGLLGVLMLMLLFGFGLPTDILIVMAVVVALVAYVIIAFFLIMAEWG